MIPINIMPFVPKAMELFLILSSWVSSAHQVELMLILISQLKSAYNSIFLLIYVATYCPIISDPGIDANLRCIC